MAVVVADDKRNTVLVVSNVHQRIMIASPVCCTGRVDCSFGWLTDACLLAAKVNGRVNLIIATRSKWSVIKTCRHADVRHGRPRNTVSWPRYRPVYCSYVCIWINSVWVQDILYCHPISISSVSLYGHSTGLLRPFHRVVNNVLHTCGSRDVTQLK